MGGDRKIKILTLQDRPAMLMCKDKHHRICSETHKDTDMKKDKGRAGI